MPVLREGRFHAPTIQVRPTSPAPTYLPTPLVVAALCVCAFAACAPKGETPKGDGAPEAPRSRETSLASVAGDAATETAQPVAARGADTIPAAAYQGWKQYEAVCARCHGEYGVGSSFAPSLVTALKPGGSVADQAAFTAIVTSGRKEKGMPSAAELGLDPGMIGNMYAYLKLRAEGKVRATRPTPAAS